MPCLYPADCEKWMRCGRYDGIGDGTPTLELIPSATLNPVTTAPLGPE